MIIEVNTLDKKVERSCHFLVFFIYSKIGAVKNSPNKKIAEAVRPMSLS